MRTDDENKLLEPYVTALGELVVEWNAMTDDFGVLFASIMFPNEPMPQKVLSAWHSIRNDLTQRKKLRAAAEAHLTELDDRFPKAGEDIEWLMTQADKLSKKRNDAIHAPLTFLRNDKGEPVSIVPSEFFGNLRAVSLGKKDDLLTEYKWYAATAEILKYFARQITASIQFQNRAWPDRPQLPTRGQKSTH